MTHFFCSPPDSCSEHIPEARVSFEQPRLIIPVCNHILESGLLCRCAARRGQRFCRHHVDLRVRRSRSGRAERLIRLSFRMPPLQDMSAVQVARARLRYALDAGHMDPSMAPLMSLALRMASGNIRFMEEQARRELAQNGAAMKALSPIRSIKYKQPLGTQMFMSRHMVSS